MWRIINRLQLHVPFLRIADLGVTHLHSAGRIPHRRPLARRRAVVGRVLLPGGMDYVSCSPYRVPIARLAAQAALSGDKTESMCTA
jgi:hypothetical protein